MVLDFCESDEDWTCFLCRMFVAGVSYYVTKHVECPVLVIKRDPKEIPDDPMDD
jgi:hypothetical protein